MYIVGTSGSIGVSPQDCSHTDVPNKLCKWVYMYIRQTATSIYVYTRNCNTIYSVLYAIYTLITVPAIHIGCPRKPHHFWTWANNVISVSALCHKSGTA